MVIASQFLDEHIKISRGLVQNVKNYTNTEKVNKRLKLIVEMQQGIIEQLNERIKKLEENSEIK